MQISGGAFGICGVRSEGRLERLVDGGTRSEVDRWISLLAERSTYTRQ